jgi:hypothetical protein
MKILLVGLIASTIVLAGCWKTFDSEKPDEYHRYWQVEENKKSSIVYPFTTEYYEERRQKR